MHSMPSSSPRHTAAATGLMAFAAAALTACGGGASESVGRPPPVTDQPRGTLISSASTGTLTKAQSDAYLRSHPDEQPLVGTTAACDVQVFRLVYATRGPNGEMVEDSAGLQIPVNCPGPYPMVLENHGTTLMAAFDESTPDQIKDFAPYLSSQGYVTVTPNYSGYGGSTLDYHPYHVAEDGAVVTIDAVRAARALLASKGIALSGKLFLFGSSQGGGVTMATHRAMERDYGTEFVVTASVPTSGSYDLENNMLGELAAADGDDPPAVSKSTLLLTAFENAYGDIYGATTEVFQSPWSGTVEGLLPGTMDAFDLVNAGLLPSALRGPGALLTDTWVNDFLINPNNTTRVRLRQNVTINWTPKVPMNLCGSSLDPAVSFANTLAAAGSFVGRGVPTTVIDVENDPEYRDFIDGRAPTGPLDPGYHGDVVHTACISYAVRHVFGPLR